MPPSCGDCVKTLLIFSARGTHLEGGNCGVQKCDFVNPLSLVIKCLWGGGHELGDLRVRTFDKRPSSPGDQVNTHTSTAPYGGRPQRPPSTPHPRTSCVPPTSGPGSSSATPHSPRGCWVDGWAQPSSLSQLLPSPDNCQEKRVQAPHPARARQEQPSSQMHAASVRWLVTRLLLEVSALSTRVMGGGDYFLQARAPLPRRVWVQPQNVRARLVPHAPPDDATSCISLPPTIRKSCRCCRCRRWTWCMVVFTVVLRFAIYFLFRVNKVHQRA